jgi:AraC-like DNA-binding protein
MQSSTVTITLMRSVVHFAQALGAPLPALCAAGGITPAQLNTPDHRITGAQARAIWQLAVERTGDADFGLHLGEQAQPAVLGLVGYVMLSATDLRAALEKLIRYTNVLTNGVRGRLECQRGQAHIEFHLVESLDNYLLTDPRHPMECTAASFLPLARALTGRALPVTAMAFQHAAPPVVHEHRRLFRVPVTFGARVTRLSFDEGALAWPVLHADPGLLAAFEGEAGAALARVGDDQPWAVRAQQAAADLIKAELPAIDRVARALKVSPRSLQRSLALEGTSFRQVVDQVRRSLAERHLARRDVSLNEIAFLLGFSEPSAFHRSFKRWTQQTPQQYRASFASRAGGSS